jgi:hypothetical protein
MFLGSNLRLVHRTENLTAIYEPVHGTENLTAIYEPIV